VSAAGGKRHGGVPSATLFALAGIAILIGIGLWQLERKSWKEALIEQMAARLSAVPASLPAREQWPRLDPAVDEFRRVSFPAEFVNDQEALVYAAGSAFRPDVSGAGYWVFTPARLAGGGVVIVNRGFVPADRKDRASRAQGALAGTVAIVGVMRWPERRGLFTPADEPRHNVWYARDPQSMAAAKNWGAVAPFYIDQEAPSAPGGVPRAGKFVATLVNNHLQYAITWFGLALALAGVYGVWLSGRWRRR
jgi:surfeit locus 1 family protein